MPTSRSDLPLTTAHLATLLDTCGDGFVVCDPEQRVVLVNAEAQRMFAYPEGQLLGRSIHELMPKRYRARHDAAFRRRLADPPGMPLRTLEGHGRRQDGSEFPILVRFSFTPLGGDLFFTAAIRDVTGLMETRQELERRAREIARLNRALARERDYLRAEIQAEFQAIVGESPAIKLALAQVDAVAPSDATVLIEGESGVGKELLARAIHERSRRRAGPLVRVNCASVPRQLFESEFFGHVKGAFTGAHRTREGRFQLAHGGTIFLDEIGEVPRELQSKLLRVLQEREFERVGEDRTRKVDVRVIAATNRDLLAEVARGAFREDLYHRLGVFPLRAPPLRERPEDIPLLAQHFLARAASELHLPAASLSPQAARALRAYPWPGNVRELQNVMERASILARGGPIAPEMLGLPQRTPQPSPGPPPPARPRRRRAKQLDRETIAAALEDQGGIILRAAAQLGVSRQALYRRMDALEMR